MNSDSPRTSLSRAASDGHMASIRRFTALTSILPCGAGARRGRGAGPERPFDVLAMLLAGWPLAAAFAAGGATGAATEALAGGGMISAV